MSAKILLADDEAAIRRAVEYALRREGHEVRTVSDGAAALAEASASEYDLAILDVMMPRTSGLDACRELRATGGLPIILLTARDGEADVIIGLEAGADDYVTKPFGLAELRSRIRAVLRRSGGNVYDEDVFTAGGRVRLARSGREVSVDGDHVEMTFSEFELLSALMANPGRVFSRLELLRAIWGDSAYRDPRGIDVHIRHLREKLEAEPKHPELILTVRGVGYRFQD